MFLTAHKHDAITAVCLWISSRAVWWIANHSCATVSKSHQARKRPPWAPQRYHSPGLRQPVWLRPYETLVIRSNFASFQSDVWLWRWWKRWRLPSVGCWRWWFVGHLVGSCGWYYEIRAKIKLCRKHCYEQFSLQLSFSVSTQRVSAVAEIVFFEL